jgi:D-glycero-alpha-D-manno-heptose-7-phosphate kinase
MIITMTPLRVSFLGGGTDYPEHFSRHGGATLATSINKYTYVTVSRLTEFFDYRIRVSYSRTELCKSVAEIQHPAVRACLQFMNIDGGVEISVVSDLPARTGLGSSSSFTVGLLHALHSFSGRLVSREQLAAEAVHVERNIICERVGLQDQYACALGGWQHLQFSKQNRVKASPVVLTSERFTQLENRLMMFYTGLQRTAHEVVQSQLERTSAGKITPPLNQLGSLVTEGISILNSSRPISDFGQLLHDGWMLKRQFSDAISNSFIDDAYSRARAAGAIGGKLLGAGGGGFLLMFVDPDQQNAVRAALAGMLEVNFSFEDQGSRVIFYKPDAPNVVAVEEPLLKVA